MQVLDGSTADADERCGTVTGAAIGHVERVAVTVEGAVERLVSILIRMCAHHSGDADVGRQLEMIFAVGGAKTHIIHQTIPVAGSCDKVRRVLGAFTREGVENHSRHHFVVFDFPAIAKIRKQSFVVHGAGI